MWEYNWPKSRPIEAKGGIKAQTQRGNFGKSWWAKRWIAVLESFNIGARLARGRTYARNGQVLSAEIEAGKVSSGVQGSQPRPYRVTIEVSKLTPKEWDKLIEVLSGQAVFAAKLLAGEMPEDIETVFAKAKLSLFPTKLNDLKTQCSCPDASNPCKHIAAVYYLLGEEFDRDPFLLFRLRGMEREELFDRLGATATVAEVEPEVIAEKLSLDPKAFWSIGKVPDDLVGELVQPSIPAAVAKRLGHFPFWRGSELFLTAMESAYRDASTRGLATATRGEMQTTHLEASEGK